MKIGYVGLGRMGQGMVSRMVQGGISVVGYDRSPDLSIDSALLSSGKFSKASSIRDLVSKVESHSDRTLVWLMVPAGDAVDSCISELIPCLSAGDIIVDGGNSNFRDSIRRAKTCEENPSKPIHFVDVGTSGGIWGQAMGFCLMVGGRKDDFDYIEPVFKLISAEGGYSYMGDVGSGHYVKMVHNAVEYGLMQSYAEGVDLLNHGPYKLPLDEVVRVWNRGGVVRSWLLELAEKMLEEDPELNSLEGIIDDSGTGRWALEEALQAKIPVPVLSNALFARFRSKRSNTISDRFVAGLRKAFGGHAVVKSETGK
ncbi:MAG TPA: decarboxylating 6-phosphogluconate dehydrogenase [Oligoflexia bacterium]|nr:decarboxylating 6-phosphogluconate dehydrogenase [Oligoflexia bacterium]HMP47475.1 decarboxylating 6-phosphogluconate dehydrogenase [Oligoflexia bacterium]